MFPAKAEDGTALKAGDTVYFSEQINDIRDASDVTTKKIYCSGANRQYDSWVSFELAGK